MSSITVAEKTDKTEGKEENTNENMATMKTGSHIEGATEDRVSDRELTKAVLVKLKNEEKRAEDNGKEEADES